jgi:hypothetical protein
MLAAIASAVRAAVQATRTNLKAPGADPGGADAWPRVPRNPS